jgi:CheY-like chemotaxis protein
MMPVMDGGETIERIRRTNRKIPIIVLSGGYFDERIQETIDSHATCFFMKPLDIDALLKAIANALVLQQETVTALHPEQ